MTNMARLFPGVPRRRATGLCTTGRPADREAVRCRGPQNGILMLESGDSFRVLYVPSTSSRVGGQVEWAFHF